MQTEFNVPKKATSKNIKNLHNTINLQQTYTTSLCSHINLIYTKLAQLDRQIQTHCLYLHSQSDSVQLNAPEYDSDIDGQTDILPDIQPQVLSHAQNTGEDPAPVTPNSEEYFALPQDSDRLESQSQSVPGYCTTTTTSQLEDILELEDKDKDWEDRQFMDADLMERKLYDS